MLSLVGMGAFILFALFSPYFTVKEINFSRDNPNIKVQEVKKSLEGLYGENLLFMNLKSVEDLLLDTFPEFRGVTASEVWPDALRVEIDLSEPVFKILNISDANFALLSEDGVILADIPGKELPTLELMDYSRPLQLGEKLITETQLNKIRIAYEIMVVQLGIPIEKQQYYPDAIELHLVSQNGTIFKLDLQLEVEPQLKKLEYGADELRLNERALEHVDLRIPERLFYK